MILDYILYLISIFNLTFFSVLRVFYNTSKLFDTTYNTFNQRPSVLLSLYSYRYVYRYKNVLKHNQKWQVFFFLFHLSFQIGSLHITYYNIIIIHSLEYFGMKSRVTYYYILYEKLSTPPSFWQLFYSRRNTTTLYCSTTTTICSGGHRSLLPPSSRVAGVYPRKPRGRNQNIPVCQSGVSTGRPSVQFPGEAFSTKTLPVPVHTAAVVHFIFERVTVETPFVFHQRRKPIRSPMILKHQCSTKRAQKDYVYFTRKYRLYRT